MNISTSQYSDGALGESPFSIMGILAEFSLNIMEFVAEIRKNWVGRTTPSRVQGTASLVGDENEEETPEMPRISWPHDSTYPPPSWVMPYLKGAQYKPIQYPPPERHLVPATKTQIRSLTACHLPDNEKDSYPLNLPPELFLIIVSELSDGSLVSLALSCKSLLSLLSTSSSVFCKVQLPSEQPSTFRTPEMSKPQVYQPARWEFLHSLERDLNETWYLCSECFILHPRRMFSSWMVPSSENYYHVRHPERRTCQEWRRTSYTVPHYTFAPPGIIDLCPCIKLTIGKTRRIVAQLRENARKTHANDCCPTADFWWHECRQMYGNVQVELRIGFFLYDGTEVIVPGSQGAPGKWIFNWTPIKGDLGAVLEYRLTFPLQPNPLQPKIESPRLLCPHRNLVKRIQRLLKCCEAHENPGTLCDFCRNIQFCQYCLTEVHDLRKLEKIETYANYGWILRAGGRFDESSATTIGLLGLLSGSRRNMINLKMQAYSFRVEKCLDGNLWPLHTVFPYARRQIALDGSPLVPYRHLACQMGSTDPDPGSIGRYHSGNSMKTALSQVESISRSGKEECRVEKIRAPARH